MEHRFVGRIGLHGPDATGCAEPERRTAETVLLRRIHRQEARGHDSFGGGRRLLSVANSVGRHVRRRANVISSAEIKFVRPTPSRKRGFLREVGAIEKSARKTV